MIHQVEDDPGRGGAGIVIQNNAAAQGVDLDLAHFTLVGQPPAQGLGLIFGDFPDLDFDPQPAINGMLNAEFFQCARLHLNFPSWRLPHSRPG